MEKQQAEAKAQLLKPDLDAAVGADLAYLHPGMSQQEGDDMKVSFTTFLAEMVQTRYSHQYRCYVAAQQAKGAPYLQPETWASLLAGALPPGLANPAKGAQAGGAGGQIHR